MQRIVFTLCVVTFALSAHGARLAGVVVYGSSLFTQADYLPHYRDRLGSPITPAMEAEIAALLTAQYESAGYLTPSIQPKLRNPDDAILTFMVEEARITNVNLAGRRYLDSNDSRRQRRQIMALRRLTALSHARFDAAVQALGEQLDLHVTGRLVRDPREDYGYVAHVHVRPRQLQVGLEVNNYGSARFDHELYKASLSWRGNHLGTLARYTSASDSQAYRQWLLRVAGEFGSNDLAVSVADTASANDAATVFAERQRLRVRARRFLLQEPRRRISVEAALDAYETERRVSDLTSLETVRATQLGLAAASVQRLDSGMLVSHRFYMSLRKGLDAAGAQSADPQLDLDFLISRARYRYWLRFEQPYEIKLDLRAQISVDSLPSAERITYGGNITGGSLEPGSVAGDSGFSARFTAIRKLPLSERGAALTLYGFADYGWARTNRIRQTDAAASVGLGLTLTHRFLDARLEFAQTVREPRLQSLVDSQRVLFSVGLRY